MLNLKVCNIDMSNQVIHIVNEDSFRTKNGKNRDVPVSKYLSSFLKEYVNTWVHLQSFELSKRTNFQSADLFCNEKGDPIKSKI
jgi:hypothetical protein